MTLTSVRTELPRVYELKDAADDARGPNAYFRNLDVLLSDPDGQPLRVFRRLERNLTALSNPAWEGLKARALAVVAKKKRGRGWQPLFDVLNEARGFR